jgi:hypothetical protein
MNDKPRKRSTLKLTDNAMAQAMADDDYEPAKITFRPDKGRGKREAGRPPQHKWERIDAVLGWYDLNRQMILRDTFIESVRKWCATDNPGVDPPDERTLRKHLEKLAK